MNLAALSIKRPIFISSIVLLLLLTGYISMKRLGVDVFPDVNIPVVTVTTIYPGAGPEEIERLISRPLEEELSSISGLKRVTSYSQDGVSLVFAEFNLSRDIKDAEQQVRNKVARARRTLPDDIEEPVIIRFDPADQPVLRLSITADLPPAKIYDVASEFVKPKLEQVADVGGVRIVGGVRREIHVELDRNRLLDNQVSAVMIGNQLKSFGLNVPVGKSETGLTELSFRTIGQFDSIRQIERVPISFSGELGNTITLGQVGNIKDTTADEITRCTLYAPSEDVPLPGFFNKLTGRGTPPKIKRDSRQALFIDVFKQSGANTVAVADLSLERIKAINNTLKDMPGNPKVFLVRDTSVWIRMNIEEVGTSIILGVILAVLVVYLFLGNPRSTLITGMALPNSLLGAFILMYIMGFTINVMTLLALSLSVGLLVDDAIVVRENIFRKLEEGMPVVEAAERGTNEVALAVVATTMTVVAVFLPVGFLSGIVGQFFKQFGLTVVFAMLISLFDAMTIAPMLSAYFAGKLHQKPNRLIQAFDRFQNRLEGFYGRSIGWSLRNPLKTLGIAVGVFALSILSLGAIKKTFLPPNDQGEFQISVQLNPGASLNGTQAAVNPILEKLKAMPEVNMIATVLGNANGESNTATIGVALVKYGLRNKTTIEIKEEVRRILETMPDLKTSVNDYSAVGGGVQYPMNLNIQGDNLAELEKYSTSVIEKMKKIEDLIDVQTDYRGGKPEYQIQFDPARMETVGVTAAVAGAELRFHVAGGVVGKFYDNGLEYDVRVRLRPDQRDLKSAYYATRVPNMNFRMIPVSAISNMVQKSGPERITRQDRTRVVTVHANLAPGGAIGSATEKAKAILMKELPPPKGVTFAFWGQSEDFKELMENILLAFGLALVFIYLVLASLYESFITPITILFAIPPAISGAFFALAVTGEMLNIFSMIGLIMLMGLVTKNSILLVDFALNRVREGMSHAEAITKAGIMRLRPILMTSMAMIAGILPVALGIGELAKSRRAMGIAIVGGLIVSTFITLVIVPVIFGYMDRFREWIEKRFRPEYDMSRVGKLDEIPPSPVETAPWTPAPDLESGYFETPGTETKRKKRK